MRTIWKYPIPEGMFDENIIAGKSLPHAPSGAGFYLDVPEDSKPLCVRMTTDGPMMWIEVVPGADSGDTSRRRFFQVIGTGHEELPDEGAEYIGTWFQDSELFNFVFHVYELDPSLVAF